MNQCIIRHRVHEERENGDIMSKGRNRFASDFGISDEVVKALDTMGYKEPMPVQEEVIKDIQKGQDLIVQANTGSGKTAAFGIPIVDQIVSEIRLPQTLVLTPTRELAVQVCEEMADIGRYKKIRCLPVYGKQPIHIQLRQLKQRVHVVVGTPGRLGDLIKRKHLDLSEIKYLVIDEADELLKRGFIDEVESIIKKVPTDRTTLLFSATMPEKIENICKQYMTTPDRIEVASKEAPIESIKQTYLEVADDWKFMRLKELIENKNPASCMIFCNTRAKVDDLLEKLKVGRYKCAALHGAMAQKYRLKAIADFREGRIQYLVATDLAARGIHVDKLDLVINYNVPNEAENYVHRIGRTGRAGEKGEAITFVNVHDKKRWQDILAFIGYEVPKNKDEMAFDGHKLKKEKGFKGSYRKADAFTPKKREKKHKDIIRLRINIGKKKKVRPGDILGAVSNIAGIHSEDIGIIDIHDTCSYVDIHNNKGDLVCQELLKTTVKGKSVTVKRMKR